MLALGDSLIVLDVGAANSWRSGLMPLCDEAIEYVNRQFRASEGDFCLYSKLDLAAFGADKILRILHNLLTGYSSGRGGAGFIKASLEFLRIDR